MGNGVWLWFLLLASFGANASSVRPELRDIYGANHYYDEFADDKTEAIVLVVLDEFCPIVSKSLGKLRALYNDYNSYPRDRAGLAVEKDKTGKLVALTRTPGPKVRFLGIFTKQDMSAKRMAKVALEGRLPFRMLADTNLELVKKYGLDRLSQAAVLDRQWNLKYKGPIDDQLSLGNSLPKPNNHYLRDALNAVLAGKTPEKESVPAVGCLIDLAPRTHKSSYTYYRDVAPILQNRCEKCHRPGEVGPMPLTSAREVIDYSEMIASVVRDEQMPPWPGQSTHQLRNSEALTDAEREILLSWLRGEKSLGDAKEAPASKTWPAHTDWKIQTPDVIFKMPEPFRVPESGTLEYVYIPIPINGGRGFDEDRWIDEIECKPGATAVVHHLQVQEFLGPILGPNILPLDQIRHYGFSLHNARLMGSFTPGNYDENARIYSRYLKEGQKQSVGMKLRAGANLLLELHYTPNGKETLDVSQVGIHFAKGKTEKVLESYYPFRKRSDMVIPANSEHHSLQDLYHFGSEYPTAGRSILIYGIRPHMHSRGKNFRVEIVDAKKITKKELEDYSQHGIRRGEEVLSIPVWDYNWQHLYRFEEPILLRPDQAVLVTASWDNTKHNPRNPNPEDNVIWGQQTAEEMFNTYFMYEVMEK